MVLILASGMDEALSSLAIRWRAVEARVLTPAHLSSAGWIYRLPASSDSVAVVGNVVVDAEEITGVLTRLPHITEMDLPHIAPEDRAYVAAEMEAFLTAWLGLLRCPVINRPSPGCLCGPNWRSGQWVNRAAGLGIPVVAIEATTEHAGDSETSHPVAEQGTTVVVVGGRVFGNVDQTLSMKAAGLAEFAAVDFLEVRFTGPDADAAFIGASLLPPLADDDVEAAVLDLLQRKCRCQ